MLRTPAAFLWTSDGQTLPYGGVADKPEVIGDTIQAKSELKSASI
jgi:hypothetical protein